MSNQQFLLIGYDGAEILWFKILSWNRAQLWRIKECYSPMSACILKIWNTIRMGRGNPSEILAPTAGRNQSVRSVAGVLFARMAGRNQGVRTVAGVLFAPTAGTSTFAGRVVAGRFARSMESRNNHV